MLVDITMNLFYETASVITLPEDVMNKCIKDIFQFNINYDRQGSNNEGLQLTACINKKNEIPETSTGLEFLFCNVHFLLLVRLGQGILQ